MEGSIKKRTITTKPDGTRIEEIEYNDPVALPEPLYIPYIQTIEDVDDGTCAARSYFRLNPGKAWWMGVCYCPRCSPTCLTSTTTVLQS